MTKSLLITFAVLMTLSAVVTAGPIQIENRIGSSDSVIEEEIMSSKGIKFELTFRPEELLISITGTNPSEEFVNSYLTIIIDDARYYERNVNFSAEETWNSTINLTYGVDLVDSSHSVIVSTVGSFAEFEFERDMNSSSRDRIPKPYISEVDITNGTIDGEPSAVAKVTVANPSIQTYPLKLMVHTLGTDGSFYGASVRPGENSTITVELLDERGTQIAGEARLYAGNLSKGDGAMDQVGFVGRADEDTKTWNETYEPIKGPWRNDGYRYHNATYEEKTTLAERLSGGHEIFGIPIVYVAAGLLVGFALIRRRR